MADLNTSSGALIPTRGIPAVAPAATFPTAQNKTASLPTKNPNMAMQTPGTMGIAPTTTASFGSLPSGSMQPPAVVTSKAAEDHVTNMTNATSQATSDAQTMAAYNAATKANAAATATSTADTGKTTDTTADDSIDSLMKSLGLDTSDLTDEQKQVVADDQAQIAADAELQNTIGDQLTSMEAGTFPLTPAEQNQISATRSSFDGAMAAAQQYAKSVQMGATVLVAKNGQQMYSPKIALGTIQTAITAGQAKVGEVNARISSAVSKLTTTLQNGDYKTATTLYKQIGDDITTRTKEIDAVNKVVSDAQTQLLKTNATNQAAFTKSLSSILQSAGEAGAPADVIDAIAQSPDIASAVKAAGTFLTPTSNTGLVGEYSLYAQQARAMGQNPIGFMEFAQKMANLKTPAPKSTTSTALSSVGASGVKTDGTKVTQADTTSWLSDFYGAGGNVSLPSLGIGNLAAGVKVGILNGIANHALTLGIDGSKFAAILASKQGAKQAINTISRNQGMMTVAESTANSNFDQILGKMSSLPPKTLSPLLNEFIQTGAIQVGDPNVKPFAALLMTALNEYAKVITGQTSGAAVSDAARKEAQSMVGSGDTPDSIRNFIATAKQEMGNRVSGYDDAKNQFYSLVGSVYGDVTPPAGDEDLGDPSGAIADEQKAQAQVDQASTGNAALQKTVYAMLSQNDATLGRPLAYSEIEQVLQATGQMK